jgi:hypothetical protein
LRLQSCELEQVEGEFVLPAREATEAFRVGLRQALPAAFLGGVGVLGEAGQQEAVLLAVQIEIKVIYNGLDVAGRSLVVLAALVGRRLVVEHGQDEAAIDGLSAAGRVLEGGLALLKKEECLGVAAVLKLQHPLGVELSNPI